ncbi:MAG TPA: hypothetical protein VN736_02640 [Candidatus Limnocylindrales bacterium]|nr:hypothetical protein [Candidatus Limnocylindrales bacterium]
MFLRILMAAALAAGLASAQRGGGGGSRNGGGMGGEMPRVQRASKLDTIADKLGLSKEQREEFQQIVSASAEKAGPLNEQLNNGRQQLTGVMATGRDSGEDFEKLKSAYIGVLSLEAGLEADTYQKLYAILKDKQKTKAAPVFAELMSGLYERSAGPGGGGGRRR